MKKYWISFYSGYYSDEGCSKPPFQVWISGVSSRRSHLPQFDFHFQKKDDCSICALVEANSIDEIWKSVKKHFPDYEERFCDEVGDDYKPSDRFPDFKNKISLV